MIATIHYAQIREHGGRPGVRDESLIQSALARPRNKFAYEATVDLAILAAAYGFGLVKNHGFVDGNKRVALMAMYVFLFLNGMELDAPEPQAVSVMESLAAGKTSERALAEWLRNNLRPVRR
jgi:death-on-curing protein